MSNKITVFVSRSAPIPTGKTEKSIERGFLALSPDIQEMDIDMDRIKNELSKLLISIGNVDQPDNSRFDISEIEFNLGFNASGKLSILGTGAEVGLESSIKVIIKRTDDKK
ncbi:MAG: hypothetical protein WC602_01770 [archaeon]